LESWAVPSYIFSSFSMFVLNHSQVTLLASAFEVEYATMFLTSCFFTWPLNENSSAFATRSGLLKLANPSRYRNRSSSVALFVKYLSSFPGRGHGGTRVGLRSRTLEDTLHPSGIFPRG